MPVPTVGSRPGGAPSSRPGGSPIVQQLNDIFARSGGNSPAIRSVSPTSTQPVLSLSDRLAGRSSPAPAPSIAGGYRPSSVPTGNPNLSARLAGRSAPTVPGGLPSTAEVVRLPLPSAPRVSIPGGAAGGLLIGSLIGSLPTEIPRLRDLLSNPQQYWQEQDRRLRQDYPFLFPPADTAQVGLIPALRPALAVAPFQGGQSPGILYNVEILQTIDGVDTLFSVQATGPIGGVSRTYTPGEITNSISFSLITGAGAIGLGGRVGGGDVASGISYSVVGAVRVDGQPDTGGNPAPVVDPNAAPRPALAAPNTLYIEPTPSRVPNAVPYNAPTVTPTPVLNPVAPNPFAPPAGVPNSVPTATPTPTANPYAPTAPQVGSRQERQHQTNEGGSIIPWLIPAAAIGALGGWALARQTTRIETPVTPTPTPTPTPFTCRFRDDPFSEQTNNRAARIEAKTIAIDFFQTQQLGIIQDKLGPQLAGGIAGKLGRLGSLASKTWNFLQVDRVLNVLSWIGILHNAYMLSNSLGQTLFSAIGNVLDVFGIQKVDEEGNEEPYDVNEIVNNWVDNFGKTTFGVDEWKGIKAEWKAFNRIYQAASSIISSLQSITFSMVEMLETISNYTGRIGNALRKSGAVLQNSFNWMNPSANYTNTRFFNALNNVEEAVSNIDQVASEVLSIQETAAQLADQKSEFEQAMSSATQAVSTAETQSATVSTRPSLTITPSDERKAES